MIVFTNTGQDGVRKFVPSLFICVSLTLSSKKYNISVGIALSLTSTQFQLDDFRASTCLTFINPSAWQTFIGIMTQTHGSMKRKPGLELETITNRVP
ncbi:hypothetical protein NPIL_546261 [Nephila pilipes]|uniref:Uncharacterized protein n=1 Tax=Nephila pilipes TaxID=299642 RepID=A0A8X6UVA4_NEPPI|nr:hypothetical protein NPIL_546261 [Nephila pilipes]